MGRPDFGNRNVCQPAFNPVFQNPVFGPLWADRGNRTVVRWKFEMDGQALNLLSASDDMFFFAAMQFLMAANLWCARRKRVVKVKTAAEKKARPEKRPGRKSSKAVPSWQSSYFNELLNTESIKDPGSVKGKEFRRLFRAPYAVVKWMADLAHEKHFDPTSAKSAFGVPSVPLILKIMCVLWCLGHSGSFADLRSQAGISEQAFGKFAAVRGRFARNGRGVCSIRVQRVLWQR